MLELNDEQVARCNDIYSAAYDFFTTLTNTDDLDWDMSLLGPFVDYAVEYLVRKGYRIYFPAVVYDPHTEKEYIEEYVKKAGELGGCEENG